METPYRASGRAKSHRHQIVTPDMRSAWESYYASARSDSLKLLAEEGWRTADTIAEDMGVPVVAMRQRLDRDPKLDRKKVRVFYKNQLRSLAVYRPRV